MTSIQNKKLLFATTLSAVILAATIMLLVTNTTQEAVAQVKQPGAIQGIGFVVQTPTDYVANGGKSAVQVEIPVQHIDVKRGTTTTVDVTLEHIASNNPYPFVNVDIITPYHEIYYPPSLTASTTEEQRLNATETGKLIPGSVDLSTLVSYSETGPITIDAGGKYVVKMYVTVPNDIPSDMIGNGGHIQIPLEVTDSNGNSNTVIWQNGGIDFTVVG